MKIHLFLILLSQLLMFNYKFDKHSTIIKFLLMMWDFFIVQFRGRPQGFKNQKQQIFEFSTLREFFFWKDWNPNNKNTKRKCFFWCNKRFTSNESSPGTRTGTKTIAKKWWNRMNWIQFNWKNENGQTKKTENVQMINKNIFQNN